MTNTTPNQPSDHARESVGPKSTPARLTLGQVLDQMAKAGLETCAETMHAGSDYAVQSRAYSKAIQDNASDSKLASTDALLVKVYAELMQTSTAQAMLALATSTLEHHRPEGMNQRSARLVVGESFKRVLGLAD